MEPIRSDNPLHEAFLPVVQEQVARHVASQGLAQVETYLTTLLVDFAHTDRLYAVRDADGRPVTTVSEMVAQGDVRLHAESFTREREVHKHIGDFLLFWGGVYPDHLQRLRLSGGQELICDYRHQGIASYRLVSTFSHPPYEAEADLFRQLSDGFSDFTFVLAQVGRKVGLRIN
jgi:hypothetical protein